MSRNNDGSITSIQELAEKVRDGEVHINAVPTILARLTRGRAPAENYVAHHLPAEPADGGNLLNALSLLPSARNHPMRPLIKNMYQALSEENLEKLKIAIENFNDIPRYILNNLVVDVAGRGNREIATYIFNLPGININYVSIESNQTPLLAAIEHDNRETFDVLMDNPEVDVNKFIYDITGLNGTYPLMSAIKPGRDYFLERLLSHPKIVVSNYLIQYLMSRKRDIFIHSPYLGKISSLQKFRSIPGITPSKVINTLQNRAWTRRRAAVQAWTRARVTEEQEERNQEVKEVRNQAAKLREQLASNNLTPAQKAGIAARARAINKKANNMTRNSRRSRRGTRRARKY